MARRAKSGPNRLPPRKVEDITADNIMIDKIAEAVQSGVLKDLVLEVENMSQMPVQRKSDGAYRNSNVSRGEEFMPVGVRLGKKPGTVIFEFKPVDPDTDYRQYEADDAKVFHIFPELEPLILRVLDLTVTDTDDAPVRFAAVKHLYLKEAEAEAEKARQEALAEIERKKQEAIDKEAKRQADHYAEHPTYGTWG
jgi:hypothetical protein